MRTLVLFAVLAAATVAEARPRRQTRSAQSRSAKVATRPAAVAAAPNSPTGPKTGMAPTRIDFDDRLVQGQGARAGSVYLYDRKGLNIECDVKPPESFRSRLLESVHAR